MTAITISESFAAVGTQIASSATAYATTGADEKIIIDLMEVFNTNTTTETIKGYIETAGGSPGADDQVFEDTVVTVVSKKIDGAVPIRLNNSQSLFLLTTTAVKVNLHLSGRRIVG